MTVEADMTAPFTIRLDEDVADALDALAGQMAVPRDSLVARAIEDYVALNAWQIGKIEAGLAAADRGDFADHIELERLRQKYTSSG